MKTAARPKHSKILILDFGSQYTQVIARRIRELQVYSEVVPFDLPAAEIKNLNPNGIILSGGPASVYDKGAPQIDPEIFSLGIPVLGICYGLMLMAHHLGGKVVFSGRREYGAGMLHITNGSELFEGLEPQLDVWNSHGDEVTRLPQGFRAAARTEGSEFAEEEVVQRVFGVNFHIRLEYIDASDRFLTKLRDVTDPEQKRKLIGTEFIDVFQHATERLLKEEHAAGGGEHGGYRFLAQGTLYP